MNEKTTTTTTTKEIALIRPLYLSSISFNIKLRMSYEIVKLHYCKIASRSTSSIDIHFLLSPWPMNVKHTCSIYISKTLEMAHWKSREMHNFLWMFPSLWLAFLLPFAAFSIYLILWFWSISFELCVWAEYHAFDFAQNNIYFENRIWIFLVCLFPLIRRAISAVISFILTLAWWIFVIPYRLRLM